jgi:hypothetical protein
LATATTAGHDEISDEAEQIIGGEDRDPLRIEFAELGLVMTSDAQAAAKQIRQVFQGPSSIFFITPRSMRQQLSRVKNLK